MKSLPSPRLCLLLALAACMPGLCPVASAQRGVSIPVPVPGSNNRAFETRNTGSTADTENKTRLEPKPKPVTVQYIAVTPVRIWTNNQGKAMQARLLAFLAPKQGESGPTEVIRTGKIRFLLINAKKPILYPLANLSDADQDYVRGIAKAARRGVPATARPTAEAPEKSPATPETPRKTDRPASK